MSSGCGHALLPGDNVVSLLDEVPPCTQENPKHRAQLCSFVHGCEGGGNMEKELEQAELAASSPGGLEKLQVFFRSGHELWSCWPCLSAGFTHVLLLGPDGDHCA